MCLDRCLLRRKCHFNVYYRHLDFIPYFMVIQITGGKNFLLFFFLSFSVSSTTLSTWFFASSGLSHNLVSLQFLTRRAIITCQLLFWGYIQVFEYGYSFRLALSLIGCLVLLFLLLFSLLSWERVRGRYWFVHISPTIYFNFYYGKLQISHR